MFKVLISNMKFKETGKEKPRSKSVPAFHENNYFGSDKLKTISRYPILDISLASI